VADDVEIADRGERPVDRGTGEDREVPVVRSAVAVGRLRHGDALRSVSVDVLELRGQFTKPVRVTGSDIGRLVLAASFEAGVSFQGSSIRELRATSEARFAGGLSLRDARAGEIHVAETTVSGPVDLTRLRVARETSLEGVAVDGRLRGWDAEFGSWVNIQRCTFTGLVDLRAIRAAEGVRLVDSHFGDDLWLRGAAVQYRLDFSRSSFAGHVDLSRAKLFDFVYFEGIRQGPKQQFSFANVVAQRVAVDPLQLAGRLRSEQLGDHASAAAEYGLLRANYQALHRFDDEDWAYRNYKRNRRRMYRPSWREPIGLVSKFVDWLVLDHGIAYATSPGRAVQAALLLIGGFALVYATANPDLSPLRIAPPAEAGWIDRLGFGLLVSGSLFTGGLSLDLLGNATGWVRAAMVVEALLGLLLWGLFIVSFSRKIIR
jgi:hypothetical protein